MHERIEEIRKALECFIKAMVEHDEQVKVTTAQHGPQVDYRVLAAQSDLRRLIGSGGSNFDALSTLIWSMGNLTQPPIKTRLLRFEPQVSQPTEQAEDVDPSDLFTAIAVEKGLPSLRLVTASQMRGVLEAAGSQAVELRAYLLAMRKDDLSADVQRMLNRFQGD